MMNLLTCACGIFSLFAGCVFAGHAPYDNGIGKAGPVIMWTWIFLGITSLALGFALPPDGLAINISGTILWGLFWFLFLLSGIAID